MPLADEKLARALPLLDGLDPARIDRLLADASIERHPKGALLFAEGDTPERLHLLLSGSIEAFINDGSRDCSIVILSAPDMFMPAAALVDEPYLLSSRVLRSAKLLSISAEIVRAEMTACPILACRLVKALAGQHRLALRHIKDLKTRSGPQRLAAFLLWLVDEKGEAGAAELPYPKGTLASRLGMTAETFSRAVQTLSDHGLVVRGHRVVLKDRVAAARFCYPDPLIDGGEHGLDVWAW